MMTMTTMIISTIMMTMDYDSDGNDYFEIQCPNCGEDVMIDFDMIDDDNAIVCPNCHEEIELEFDCDCDDDDCDCGHEH